MILGVMCFIQPVFAKETQNDTFYATFFSQYFANILASSGIKQSKLQRADSNRSWITDKKLKNKIPYVFFVFVIFETYNAIDKELHSYDIVQRVSFTMKPFFFFSFVCV